MNRLLTGALAGCVCAASIVAAVSSRTANATAASTDQATTYQINPAHDGWQPQDTIAPPLKQVWADDFGQLTSYPVVADGRAFVIVANDINANPPYANYGESLYALDQSTGRLLWGPVALGGTYTFGGATYDGGRLFAVNLDGLVRAFDPATGALIWQQAAPGNVDSAPVAVGGTLYLSIEGSDAPTGSPTNSVGWAALAAMNESDGSLLWNYDVACGCKSSPVVDSGQVFASYDCEQSWALSLSGSLIWHYVTGCSGGGGRTATAHDGTYYVRDPSNSFPPVRLDQKTGSTLGKFDSFFAPAFNGSVGYFTPQTPTANGLQAEQLPTLTPLWNFSGDGGLVTAPVGANGYVYIGSASGNVYAVNAANGQQAWVANAGAPVGGPTESNETVMPGLAIAAGMLFVPTTTGIVAFAPSGGPAPPSSPSNVQAIGEVNQARVSWTPPSTDNGSPLTSYRVDARLPGADGPAKTYSVPANQTSFTATGLPAGTCYRFIVYAANAEGLGPPAPASNCAYISPGPSSPPTAATPWYVQPAKANGAAPPRTTWYLPPGPNPTVGSATATRFSESQGATTASSGGRAPLPLAGASMRSALQAVGAELVRAIDAGLRSMVLR